MAAGNPATSSSLASLRKQSMGSHSAIPPTSGVLEGLQQYIQILRSRTLHFLRECDVCLREVGLGKVYILTDFLSCCIRSALTLRHI